MIEGFTPWEVHQGLVVPTPWALEQFGVPAEAVEVAWAAAPNLEQLTGTCQVMAALRIQQAQLQMWGPPREEIE